MEHRNEPSKPIERITVDPKILVGKPVVKGTRLSVEFILGLLAHGMSTEEIIAEYPGLTRDDIVACLSFAAQTVGDSSFVDFDSVVA